MLNDDRKTIHEAYLSATSATDLRCDGREGAPRGAVDLLIAAGATKGQLGTALIRLQAEWDGCAKPRKPTIQQITTMAMVMTGDTQHQRLAKARKEAGKWYKNELSMLAQRLKTLPRVRAIVERMANARQVMDPQMAAYEIVFYWLDSTCQTCHGRGQMVVEGTPMLGRTCKHCHGSGKEPEPLDQVGRRILNSMDDAVHVTKQSMKHRLH